MVLVAKEHCIEIPANNNEDGLEISSSTAFYKLKPHMTIVSQYHGGGEIDVDKPQLFHDFSRNLVLCRESLPIVESRFCRSTESWVGMFCAL